MVLVYRNHGLFTTEGWANNPEVWLQRDVILSGGLRFACETQHGVEGP